MPATIAITDDTTTVTLTSGDYGVTAWSPRVARRRPDGLGGRGPYEDVLEEINVFVQDTTSADFLLNITKLRNLLDQVERWAGGENVDAVKIQYTPVTSGTQYEAIITGVPDDALIWNEMFPQAAAATFSTEFAVRFFRGGLWLESTDSASEGDATANNPGTMSDTFASTIDVPSPVKVALSFGAQVDTDSNALLLLGQSSSHLDFFEAEDGTYDDGDWADTAVSTASNGNVARYTPNDTQIGSLDFSPSLDSDVRRVVVVAHLVNRSSTISYQVRAQASGAESRWFTLEENNTDKRIFSFGVMIATKAITTLTIQVQADGTGASSNSLDIDVVAIVSVDDDVGRIIAINSFGPANSLTIDPLALDEPSPRVYDHNNNGQAYNGDSYLSQIENTIAMILIGNTGGDYRLRDSGSSVVAVGFTATRNPGRLVVE